jgi:hypothetical protein
MGVLRPRRISMPAGSHSLQSALLSAGAKKEMAVPILRRELAFRSRSMAANDGEWWHLVLETEPPGLFVEHTWERQAPLAAEPERGAERFGINDFLTFRDGEPAHAALLATLGRLFEPPG